MTSRNMKLRLRITALFTIFISLLSFAQQPLIYADFDYNLKGKSMIGLKTDFSVGANTIRVKSLFDVRNTNYIDDELKQDLYGNLKTSNRAGGHSYFGGSYSWTNDSVPSENANFYTVGYQYTAIYSARFSDNLGYGILYGNKDFAGLNVGMGPTNIFRIDYSKLSLGHTWRVDNQLLHISGSLLLGHRLQHGIASTFEMYTDPNGDYIDLNVKGRGYLSDTATSATFAVSGGGIGLDMFYSLNNENGHTWSFGIYDMGIILWDKNSLYGKREGVFRYEGFYVENIFDLNDSVWANSSDSLVESFVHVQQGAVLRPTPPLLMVNYSHSISNGLLRAVDFGVNYRMYNSNIPLVYAMARLNPMGKSELSPYLSFGGYNRFGVGLDYLLLSNGFDIHLNIGNLQTLITAGNGYGVNGGIRILYHW
jgi:hypothetical protein